MWIANCMDTVGDANISSGRSFVLGWPTVNFVATFRFRPEDHEKHCFQRLGLLVARWHLPEKPLQSCTICKTTTTIGVSLTGICDKDNLPFPILDMLSVINRKGPLLEGIFRKPACINSCRNLKEKLNSGDRVNCYSKSVHVVACVLKDFLENIEGSLLSSKLYEKWLGVLNEVTEKEKINAAQRLLTQLPKANVVLLRYLFGVLYNIEQQSSSNQMTAYDLSVCIAPSILCPLNSCSLELEDNFIKKASLVQFLIENCLKIFGEDITSLLGENSKSCHNNEKAADSVQNTLKSTSFRDSAFCQRIGTSQYNQCTALLSAKPGQLFGVSLTDIFDKDIMPLPILDMLSFINEKGPLTEGIFRKPGSIKSCGILKKKLNSGDRVRHYSKSVLVVAFVLKDFLENIEGSLLSSDLYEKWLGVLDEVTQKEKINAAQRLLTQLPKVNVVLLRYLFGVLYNIEQQSSSNQMTAYDLSVCIAPSILCPPNSCNLELEDNFIKKASLIQFLIEYCLKIFGEDITSLLGENSKSCHNNEKAADSDQNTKESSAFTNSSFGHCAGTWQNNQCTAAPSEKSGQLFGVSLTDIFHKDNFPFPILDFLENIEGSLLSSELYEKWLGVLDEVTEEEKINAAQRLLAQLPNVNVVVLRYLFGVLYSIEQESSPNQITPYDLSVCIAPSILCPPNSGSLELEENFVKKASLIQFLYENCLGIFGEDITSLLGENSKSCHNNEKAADSVQNTKESSAFTNSSFGHCAGTWQNNQCTAAPSEKSGQLFGVSLTDIFHKDNFPFPILDFLENIEGSLLSSELYEKWLDVLDEVTEEEKINAAQRLLAQLPNVNVVVLRYLFGVLYSIEQESSPNQITPYDLSVCIAPSILCPPNSGSLELEENFVKKASLIQFLYENCLGIFGEDITSLLGENSKSCHNNEKAADSGQKTTKRSLFRRLAFWCCGGICWNKCTAEPSAEPRERFGVPSRGYL
ncbi:uncharacterized protein [Canis lupus baileyi]|uniref:uncharacterized protein n=1 Tax=Canis lupus baileyi TaxID=143281 RepID=UPI003B96B110